MKEGVCYKRQTLFIIHVSPSSCRLVVDKVIVLAKVSGRGFLGLSQSGVSAHEFDSEPSAVSSSENEGMVWSDDEPVQEYVH